MKPGVYYDLDFGEYLAIDALSNTRLGQLAQSPLHYHKNAGLDEKAKHLVIGSLVHAGRLEPLALAERYAVMPAFERDEENRTRSGERSYSKTTVYYKEKRAEYEKVNSDKQIVERDWFEQMVQVVGALCECEPAHRLLTGPGKVEATMVWEDPEFGILCKGRIDRVCPSRKAFADLKTTVDLLKFPKSIASYGYHRQMAHYQQGWAATNGGKVLHPWIIAAEKAEPYCVQAAPLCEEALAAGYRQRRKLMQLLVECMENNHWPGPESPDKWRLPEWALDDGEEITLTVGGETIAI